MTLDEAIIHCEEVAEEQEQYYNQDGIESFCVKHSDCASEHRQLAEWLKLLKRILDSGDCNECALSNSHCRYAPRWGEQVRYNCPFYAKEGDKNVDAYTR